MLRAALNWVCCCGAFEDLFGESRYREYSEEEVSFLSRPLVSDEEGTVERKQGNGLIVNNILGFGRKDVLGDYILGETLGEGAFGVVTRCTNKATGQNFACKKIEKKQLRRKADVEDIRREVQILMLLSSHPSVAALCAVYEDSEAVYLILELCEGGQVFDRLISMGTITEQYISQVFRQMVELVDQCHTLGIAHRDVKPENFLFATQDDNSKIKAADFGLSQFFTSGKVFTSLIGSAYYVAPEVLNRNYGPQADIWSLGVCLYVMLSGSPPFDGQGEDDIFDKILYHEPDFSRSPWPSVSSHAKLLLKNLLKKSPDRRPDTKAILQHRWLCEMAPHQPLGDVVIERLRTFAGMTKVKHETVIAATQAIEAGSTPEMLDMVTSRMNDLGRCLDRHEVGELLASYDITVPEKVKESLSRFSKSQVVNLSTEDSLAAALGRSEARRDEFVQRLYNKIGSIQKMPFENFEKAVSTFTKNNTNLDGDSPSFSQSDIEELNKWLQAHHRTAQERVGIPDKKTSS